MASPLLPSGKEPSGAAKEKVEVKEKGKKKKRNRIKKNVEVDG